MNKVILVFGLLVVSLFSVNGQSCLPDGITLESQQEVDDFATNYPNCTEIEGSLTIEQSLNETITNLDGLSQLTSIVGGLRIWDSDIQDLSGLSNLESVGGQLRIGRIDLITELSAFDNLVSIGELYIGQTSFDTLSGFNAVESISSLAIIGNGDLINVNMLNNVTAFGSLELDGNPILSSVNGFSQLNSLVDLEILDHEVLTDLSGFSGLETVGEDFRISGNNALLNLYDFANLTSVGAATSTGIRFSVTSNASLETLFNGNVITGGIEGDIFISFNPVLVDLPGLNGITSCFEMEIEENLSLQDISSLQNLTHVEEEIEIGGNPLLSSLPLFSLESVGSFAIQALPLLSDLQTMVALDSLRELIVAGTGLTDFTGLENITTLESFWAVNNSSLTSFNGLNNLTAIDSVFFLSHNLALPNLVGLEGLTYVDDFSIFYNDGLTNFEGCNNLTTIEGNFTITNDTSIVNFEGLDNLATINGDFSIDLTESLQNLDGLENLATIGGKINFRNNELLDNLAGIGNADLAAHTDSILIRSNPLLSLCSQDNICNYILTGGGGTTLFVDNAPGCNSMNEVTISCFDDINNTNFVGNIYADMDQDCLESADDLPWTTNTLVYIENDDYSYGVTTDENGNYWLPALAGEYTINMTTPSAFWTSCFTDSLVVATATNDTITTDFFASPLGDCPYLEWDMILQPLRICGDRTVVIEYCNYGVQPAEDAVYAVLLDTFMTLSSASIPYTVGGGGELLFDIETVDVLECGQFEMSVFLDCDSVEINDVQCFDVELMSDQLCAPNDTTWDGSIVEVSGYCENDSIYFRLENIGAGDMGEPAQFRVDILIEDIVLLIEEDDYELLAGGVEILSYKMEGDGLRIEADQTIGHPIEGEATVVVPSCDDIVNNLILTMFPSNNGDPFSETFCTYAVNSFDPNIKTAIPTGVGEDHEIEKDWELDYTIQFQNTGNDVAYVVRINDILSNKLDISTLRVKGASHDFTWTLDPNRELIFTFDDIFLPDSTTNEPASHGFIQYSIKPMADLLPGDRIENLAAIYFDFNDPIITNTVFHTIRKPVVSETNQLEFCPGEMYQGMPLFTDTTIYQIVEFLEYDSVYVAQLIVKPPYNDTIAIELPIGTEFQGIFIEGDTSISVSLLSQGGCDSLVVYNISSISDVEETGGSLGQISIFPNPVSKLLYVSDYFLEDSQEWTLTNTIGRTVWSENVSSYEHLPAIRVSDYPSGIYLLKVKTGSGEKYWKVMIE